MHSRVKYALSTHTFQIAKVAMMAAKDVRPLLSALATDSIISTSEVPKTSERNPLRTIYLWSVLFYSTY